MPWLVRSLDVWAGDEPGSWQINNLFNAGDLDVRVGHHAGDGALIEAMKEAGELTSRVVWRDAPGAAEVEDQFKVYLEDDSDLYHEVMGVGNGTPTSWVLSARNDAGEWEELNTFETEEEAQAAQAGYDAHNNNESAINPGPNSDWPILQLEWLESPVIERAVVLLTTGDVPGVDPIADRYIEEDDLHSAVLWAFGEDDDKLEILLGDDPGGQMSKNEKTGNPDWLTSLAHEVIRAYTGWRDAGRP